MNNMLETLRQLGPARLGIMGATVVGLLAFFLFISMRVSTPSMEILYTELSSVDSSAMAVALEQSDIRYQVTPDGTEIRVSDADIGRARMLLAEQGLPNGGSMGFELFDQQSGFGQTNFVQNVNLVRALEGELSRTISSLEPVRNARVHLVLPERELFSRESQPASASVFLGMQPGGRLDREQILAIQSLVASGVPQLQADDVSIIDSSGNLLARGGEDETTLMSSRAEEMRRKYEQQLTGKIQDQVSSIVGFGKVRATVTAEVNFDRVSTNEELFDPETQVIRSSQLTEENNLEREPRPTEVTVGNNLPGIGEDLLSAQQPTLESNRVEEVTNFEISRTVRSTIREIGEVQRLSVAVLVDGSYITNEDGERVYEPRSEQEIEQIEALVRSAVGFDEERGDSIEVVNMQFADPADLVDDLVDNSLFGFDRSDLLDAAEIITVAIMIILVVLLVLQPMVGRLMETEPEDLESIDQDLIAARGLSPALAAPVDDEFEPPSLAEDDPLIDIQGVEGKVKASSLKKVEEIVENYPSETVSVIRSWMSAET